MIDPAMIGRPVDYICANRGLHKATRCDNRGRGLIPMQSERFAGHRGGRVDQTGKTDTSASVGAPAWSFDWANSEK
jgi:hypothetical protein